MNSILEKIAAVYFLLCPHKLFAQWFRNARTQRRMRNLISQSFLSIQPPESPVTVAVKYAEALFSCGDESLKLCSTLNPACIQVVSTKKQHSGIFNSGLVGYSKIYESRWKHFCVQLESLNAKQTEYATRVLYGSGACADHGMSCGWRRILKIYEDR